MKIFRHFQKMVWQTKKLNWPTGCKFTPFIRKKILENSIQFCLVALNWFHGSLEKNGVRKFPQFPHVQIFSSNQIDFFSEKSFSRKIYDKSRDQTVRKMCWKTRDHAKKFPWNQLFSNFFSKNVGLTEKYRFFDKKNGHHVFDGFSTTLCNNRFHEIFLKSNGSKVLIFKHENFIFLVL